VAFCPGHPGLNELWQFSISGLSTLLLLVIFLGLTLSLSEIESQSRIEGTESATACQDLPLSLAPSTALAMLTRYSAGWLILPVLAFLAWFGGAHPALNLMFSAGGFSR
jgi:hypothetical protein